MGNMYQTHKPEQTAAQGCGEDSVSFHAAIDTIERGMGLEVKMRNEGGGSVLFFDTVMISSRKQPTYHSSCLEDICTN